MSQGKTDTFISSRAFLGVIIVVTWAIFGAIWIKGKIKTPEPEPPAVAEKKATETYKFLYPLIDQNSPKFNPSAFKVIQEQAREFQVGTNLSDDAAFSRTMSDVLGFAGDDPNHVIVVSIDRDSIRKVGDHKVMTRSYMASNSVERGGVSKTVFLITYDCTARTKEVLSADFYFNGNHDGSMDASYYKENEPPYVNPGSPQEWVMDAACEKLHP